jgi:hypothetical protein
MVAMDDYPGLAAANRLNIMTATFHAVAFALLGVVLGQIVFGSVSLMIVFAIVGLWAGWVAGTLTVIVQRLERKLPPD